MRVARATACALALVACAGAALAQAPAPIPLGGGLLGGAASYVPNIPLSPAAQANLAAQAAANAGPGGGDGGGWQSQISYAHGMEFVTINVPGNALRPGVTDPNAIGSGRVTQAFAMSRFEAPNALWAEFIGAVNIVRSSGQVVPFVQQPDIGGSVTGPGAFRSVGNVSWRTAAIFCNWLHNDRQVTQAAFMSGAYDVTTFGGNSTGFTDQLTASPNARFRLPTLNEHIAASHFDPNGTVASDGTTSPRWWQYNITSDTAPVYGPPGAIMPPIPPSINGPGSPGGLAQANAGPSNLWRAGSPSPASIPLGSYPTVQSPWGLLDTAGGIMEWTETYFSFPLGGQEFYDQRFLRGSARATAFAVQRDAVTGRPADLPSLPLPEYGLRVVMVIPSPSAFCLSCAWLVVSGRRVRRV
jgi:formylglycine-generating enzyme required for sulfatase activity